MNRDSRFANHWWRRCPCGHLWMFHHIAEHPGDGTELCCTAGCDQRGCPGRQPKPTLGS